MAFHTCCCNAVAGPIWIERTIQNEQTMRGDFESVLAECDTKFADDAGGKAKCVPQCSVRYAACDAGAAYDQAKPWIEEQAKKSKKFFDDLMNDLKKDPPADPAPKDKSI